MALLKNTQKSKEIKNVRIETNKPIFFAQISLKLQKIITTEPTKGKNTRKSTEQVNMLIFISKSLNLKKNKEVTRLELVPSTTKKYCATTTPHPCTNLVRSIGKNWI